MKCINKFISKLKSIVYKRKNYNLIKEIFKKFMIFFQIYKFNIHYKMCIIYMLVSVCMLFNFFVFNLNIIIFKIYFFYSY